MDRTSKKIVVLTYIATLICMGIYIYLRRMEYTCFKEISVERCRTDKEMVICIEGLTDSDYIIISGYAYWKNEEYKNFSCSIVLREMDTNCYYKIPTQAVSRPDLSTESLNFDKTGFCARVSKKKGEFGARLYEICYLAENDGESYLVHTNEYMGTKQ